MSDGIPEPIIVLGICGAIHILLLEFAYLFAYLLLEFGLVKGFSTLN